MSSQKKLHKPSKPRRPAAARVGLAARSPGRHQESTNQLAFFRWSRLLTVGGLVIVGTTVVIAITVILTPLRNEPTLGELQQQPTSTDASQLKSSGRPTGSLPAEQLGDQPAKGRANTQLRVFPDEGAPIELEPIQQELLALAHTLESDFASDPLAFHFSGQIYQELKQTQLAEAAWRKCLEQGVTAPGPYAGLAKLLMDVGREAEAVTLLATAHASGIQSEETFRELAESQENLGLLTDAKATLDKALELYPADADAWLVHGRVLMQLKDYAQAEVSTLKSIEMSGESEKALIALSTTQVRQTKMAEAAATRQRLVDFQTNKKASSASFQEVYDSALRRVAVELYLSCSALALENQRPAEAERYSWRAIELEPGSGRAYMALIAVQRAQGQLSEALQTERHLVSLQPENPLNYVNLASLATQLGNVVEAKQALVQAVALDPDGFVAHNSLVRLHLALGEFAEAKGYAQGILEHHRSVEAYLLLSQVLEAAGEPAAANQAVQQARLLDPQHPVWKSLSIE